MKSSPTKLNGIPLWTKSVFPEIEEKIHGKIIKIKKLFHLHKDKYENSMGAAKCEKI